MKFFTVRLDDGYAPEIISGITFLAQLGGLPLSTCLDFWQEIEAREILFFDHALFIAGQASITALPARRAEFADSSHLIWVNRGSFERQTDDDDFQHLQLRLLPESDRVDGSLIRKNDEPNSRIDASWAVVAIDYAGPLSIAETIDRMYCTDLNPPGYLHLTNCELRAGMRRSYVAIAQGPAIQLPPNPENRPQFFQKSQGQDKQWELPLQIELRFDGDEVYCSGTFKNLTGFESGSTFEALRLSSR